MVTNPHPWTDDDGSGTTGTPIDNSALQNVYNDLGPESTSVSNTGTVTALVLPGGVGDLTIFLDNASLLSIKGIIASVVDGQTLTLISRGAGQVDVYHQDSNPTAANRIICMITSNVSSLAPGTGVMKLKYDLTTARWRVIHHDQGAWIAWTPNDQSGASLSLTVAGARYHVRGRTVLAMFNITYPATGSTAGSLIGGLPFTVLNGQNYMATIGFSNAGVAFTALVNSNTTRISFWNVSGVNLQNVALSGAIVEAVAIYEGS